MSRRERWHEVPFTLADEDGLVEGTIDSLVRDDSGLVVVEFKTGRPSALHQAQLATYLRAARGLEPGTPVRGVLLYPDQDVWIDGNPDDRPGGVNGRIRPETGFSGPSAAAVRD